MTESSDRSSRSVPTTPPWYLLPEVMKSPHTAMWRMLRENGWDLVCWRGIEDLYLVNHPDLIRPVLTQDHRHFSKNTLNIRILRLFLGKGLLTNDGPDWVRQRKLIQPAFAHRELARFDDDINARTSAWLHEWDGRDPGAVAWIDREMNALTFNILGETLFGCDVREHEEAMAPIREALSLRLYDTRTIQMLNPRSSAADNAEWRDAVGSLDRIIEDLVRAHERQADGNDSLLGRLLAARDEESGEGMDDQQMRDEIATIILAGHETSAMGLTWTLYLLATHPEIADRLSEHLEANLHGAPARTEDLARLPYLKQVVQEAMRIYPPIWAYARRTEHETELGEFVLPAQASIVICTYALHRHPEFWPDPERFDPDRFHPDRTWEFFAWLPFAAGPRACVGTGLAMLEIQLILAQIVQRFRMKVVPDHPIELDARVTIQPTHGIPVTLTRR